ncbi:hypothetical protein [Algoriphagus antarcticus]|uniref:Uncharacterized protein n=1 Tax=Algoriphagus antarcticus TaxID=238540 RepID=A0A3E0D3I9_9BACT|nr:hypothetical protein [Algoriphagus antarcticus]REG76441.1 hypothetical protein C8N25_1603 [Algoriphagus antarcticus]
MIDVIEFKIDLENGLFLFKNGPTRVLKFSEISSLELGYGVMVKNRIILIVISIFFLLCSIIIFYNLFSRFNQFNSVLELENTEVRKIGVNIVLAFVFISMSIYVLCELLSKKVYLKINNRKLVVSKEMENPKVKILNNYFKNNFEDKYKSKLSY